MKRDEPAIIGLLDWFTELSAMETVVLVIFALIVIAAFFYQAAFWSAFGWHRGWEFAS